jgi:hypothetical protein
MPLHNSFVLMCAVQFYFMTRTIQNLNLTKIQNSFRIINGFGNLKGFQFYILAMGQILCRHSAPLLLFLGLQPTLAPSPFLQPAQALLSISFLPQPIFRV